MTNATNTKNGRKKRAPDNAAFEEVNVLVIAAKERDTPNDCPAWLVAQALPPFLPLTPAHPSRIRIIVHPSPAPSTYAAGARFLSSITATTSTQYHLVLHVATGDSKDGTTLVYSARRDGYTARDAEGKLPADDRPPDYVKDADRELTTNARLPDVLQRWRGKLGEIDVSTTANALHDVAEYTYFGSLAHVQQEAKEKKGGWQAKTAVNLCYVQRNLGGEDGVEVGRDMVTALIYSLIDSRRQRDGDYEDETGETGSIT